VGIRENSEEMPTNIISICLQILFPLKGEKVTEKGDPGEQPAAALLFANLSRQAPDQVAGAKKQQTNGDEGPSVSQVGLSRIVGRE
jgi:hypothetical protein